MSNPLRIYCALYLVQPSIIATKVTVSCGETSSGYWKNKGLSLVHKEGMNQASENAAGLLRA
jgi:hypothetical protein